MRTAIATVLLGILGAFVIAAPDEKPPAPPPPPPPPGAGPVAPKPAAEPVTPGTPAKPEPEVPIDPVIAELVKQLGDGDYRVREKAGATLEAKGEKVLPDLRRALNGTPNPEIARRLTVMVRRMEYDRLVAPKRVTFKVKDKTPKDIFAEISKQTGYKIDYNGGGPEGKFTFDFDKETFWVAMDRVANTAGLNISEGYNDDTIPIYRQDTINPYVAYAGPFRFVATQISSNRSVQLSNLNRNGIGNRQPEYMNLSLQIHSEPKNPMLGTTEAELTEATDNTGASLIPPKDQQNRFGRSYYGGYRGHNTYANLNMTRGGRDATSIKVLKGKAGIIMLSGTVPEIVIADPAKVKNKQFTGRSAQIDVESVSEAGGNWTANVTFRKLGANPEEEQDYNWMNNLFQRLELVDEHGVKFQNYGANSINQETPGVVKMTGQFGANDRRNGKAVKMGAPAKLIFNDWITVTHEVTFEFKDMPLP